MRKRKTAAAGRKTRKTAADVLVLLGETLEAVSLAKERDTAVDKVFALRFQEFAEALRGLEPQEALQILCMDTVGPLLARQVLPFNTFPTKKVRFNVLPQSEEKLERVKKACGKKTTKDAMDIVLEFLFNQLPPDYRSRKSEVVALLSAHLPSADVSTPASLAMNALAYALLQDLAEMLGKSQGAVLEAATEMWLTELRSVRAKTEKALKIIDEFHSRAVAVEKQLEGIFGGPGPKIFEDLGPICSRFGFVMVDLENLLDAINSNINEGVPIDQHDSSQQS